MEVDEGSNVFYSILFKNLDIRKISMHIIMSSFFIYITIHSCISGKILCYAKIYAETKNGSVEI